MFNRRWVNFELHLDNLFIKSIRPNSCNSCALFFIKNIFTKDSDWVIVIFNLRNLDKLSPILLAKAFSPSEVTWKQLIIKINNIIKKKIYENNVKLNSSKFGKYLEICRPSNSIPSLFTNFLIFHLKLINIKLLRQRYIKVFQCRKNLTRPDHNWSYDSFR